MGGVIQTASTVVNTVASETWNVITSNPGYQYGKSVFHLLCGEKDKSKEAFKRGNEGMLSYIECTPGVGHAVSLGYWMNGNDARAKEAFKKATRTTVVMGAGFVAATTGGAPLLIAGSGIFTGQCYDAITEESKMSDVFDSLIKGKGVEEITISACRFTMTCLGDVAGARAGAKIHDKWFKESKPINLKPNSEMSEDLKNAKFQDANWEFDRETSGDKLYSHKKSNLWMKVVNSKEKAQGFEFAAKESIGVNCKTIPLSGGKYAIIMEGGDFSLQGAISNGLLGKESALNQVNQLEKNMQKSNVYHGDLKPDNMTVLSNRQLRTIDNGLMRKIGGPYKAEGGFNYARNEINKCIEPKPVVNVTKGSITTTLTQTAIASVAHSTLTRKTNTNLE